MVVKAAGADAELRKKVVRKAKSETSPQGVLATLRKDPRLAAPEAAVGFLQSLFATGALGAQHAEALEALSLLFQFEAAPLERLDGPLIARLLVEATSTSRGLDALVLLAWSAQRDAFEAVRPTLSDLGARVLASVQARGGEPVEPGAAPDLVRFFVEQGGIHLPTADGRIVYASAEEVQARVAHIAPAASWSAAYADHFSKPGSYRVPRSALERFSPAELVRVLLSARGHLHLDAFLGLSPPAVGLWEALDGIGDSVHANPFHPETYFLRSLLACLGALASEREGAPVPPSFERHFSAVEVGFPRNERGLDPLVAWLVDALRALGPGRAVALGFAALARDDARSGPPRFLTDAAVAAVAAADPALLGEVERRIAASPHSVPPEIRERVAASSA